MSIEQRPFGPDKLPISVLGFGCGAVGGLMVRGTQADQDRAVARVLDVLDEVVPAFEALRSAGKLRLLRLTAVGD